MMYVPRIALWYRFNNLYPTISRFSVLFMVIFTHHLIRIPHFWSIRTRMREDTDKDGPSGSTSRLNKSSKLKP